MGKHTKYFYNGEEHTLTSLVKLSGLSREALKKRLNSGWDVNTAVETPVRVTMAKEYPREMYANGDITICFTEAISHVFAHMQPKLNTPYKATPHQPCGKNLKGKLYYIIHLENGKPLIVYPTEFLWIREGKPTVPAAEHRIYKPAYTPTVPYHIPAFAGAMQAAV